ncbi:MAG TPA: 50S ribosomal protein L6 [Patescibacteria group bacterium]|nr:50S ribosomal protein L6 [Patescibacteria group bacterium]
MSKIGKKIIIIPQGVEAKINGEIFEAKGPKGSLVLSVNPKAKMEISGSEIKISKNDEKEFSREANAIWGLTRSLVNNMIIGVSEGYQKKLELQGVGYRMNVQGKKIVMALGFSHPVEKEVPEGIEAKIEENNILSIIGADKQKVGQFAAEIKSLKPVEPYKGKGFRYQGEKVRRKAGKKAATAK